MRELCVTCPCCGESYLAPAQIEVQEERAAWFKKVGKLQNDVQYLPFGRGGEDYLVGYLEALEHVLEEER